MVGLISVLGRRPVPVVPQAFDQLQRLEQAAGFSMVAFEDEDDWSEQPVGHAGLWDGESAAANNEAEGVTGRMASLIDDCAAVVTSYLRPAV